MVRSKIFTFAWILLAANSYADDLGVRSSPHELPELPQPVANNAVAAITVDGTRYIISFAGIGHGLTRTDIHAQTFVFDSHSRAWSEQAPVPGNVGRLATTATSVGELAYVFGGYSVAQDGSEISTPWVHSFDPVTGKFQELRPMPIPVDDAVSVPYLDRFIYLISGWHDLGNVNLVQRYDTVEDSWEQATPIPGAALFGHAGGIVGNKIAYCDGVLVHANPGKPRNFAASNECFVGIIDAGDSRRIDWRPIEPHPGSPRYRMASAGIASRNAVIFVGGSENPYNFNGIGYDGIPSDPAPGVLILDLETLGWQVSMPDHPASMDHRGLVPFDKNWVTIGGIRSGQDVSDNVISYRLHPTTSARTPPSQE